MKSQHIPGLVLNSITSQHIVDYIDRIYYEEVEKFLLSTINIRPSIEEITEKVLYELLWSTPEIITFNLLIEVSNSMGIISTKRIISEALCNFETTTVNLKDNDLQYKAFMNLYESIKNMESLETSMYLIKYISERIDISGVAVPFLHHIIRHDEGLELFTDFHKTLINKYFDYTGDLPKEEDGDFIKKVHDQRYKEPEENPEKPTTGWQKIKKMISL